MQPEWNVQAGQFIRRRREQLNLTQQDVVTRLSERGIPIALSSFGRIESGDAKAIWAEPSFVRSLAQVLQVSVKELLTATGHIVARQTDLSAERIMELVMEVPEDKWDLVEQMIRLIIADQQREKSGSH